MREAARRFGAAVTAVKRAVVQARLAIEGITPDDAVAWFVHVGYALPAQVH
jgi:hypothetical protein